MKVKITDKKGVETEVSIPDATVKNLMTKLEISKEEAIKVALFDKFCDSKDENKRIENKEEKELTEKAKLNNVLRDIHDAESEKVTQKKMTGNTTKTRTKKDDNDKQLIISTLFNIIQTLTNNTSVVTNKEKSIDFTFNNNEYTISLTKHRTKK